MRRHASPHHFAQRKDRQHFALNAKTSIFQSRSPMERLLITNCAAALDASQRCRNAWLNDMINGPTKYSNAVRCTVGIMTVAGIPG